MKPYPLGSDAVSPVVGVMLMLVVTLIIAGVVSAFSGGLISSQDKVPQATIVGTYSIQNGMRITHTGGDPLPMHKIVFTIHDGETFGPDVVTVTKETLKMSLMSFYNSDGQLVDVMGPGGSYSKTSFIAGDSIHIKERNCAPDLLQPGIVPGDYNYENDGSLYKGSYKNRWSLCIYNIENIGKEFILTLSDTSGNPIAKTAVVITS